MTRHTVLLLFGGESSEHEVSIASARNVYAAMDGGKYNTLLCYIDRHGKWWLLEEWQESLTRHGGKQLLAALGSKGFVTMPGNEIIHPDVIIPVLHGKNGEDGTVQGLAELLHIPIVGCDTIASAVTVDKVMTKNIAEAHGIASAKYVVYHRGEKRLSFDHVSSQLGATVFVKPCRAGSSIGVSKVGNANEFSSAIDVALEHDDRVLIEEALVGREIETAVLGNPPQHKVSGIGEIIAGAAFYDYNDKYDVGSTSQVITNVTLPESIEQSVRSASHVLYQALACRGLARIDYILVDKTPHLLEVNSFPGFTNVSMYPKLWQAAGMHYPELIDTLIADALEK